MLASIGQKKLMRRPFRTTVEGDMVFDASSNLWKIFGTPSWLEAAARAMDWL